MNETPKITSRCRACHQPTHLVQDSSGSLWMHDRLIDEHNCWTQNRAGYELPGFPEHTAVAIERILGA